MRIKNDFLKIKAPSMGKNLSKNWIIGFYYAYGSVSFYLILYLKHISMECVLEFNLIHI